MIGRRACPQCAEPVRREARICRFCGAGLQPVSLAKGGAAAAARGPGRGPLVAAGALLAILVVALLAYALAQKVGPGAVGHAAVAAAAPAPAVAPADDPGPPALAVGESLTWSGERSGEPIERQVGPLRIRIDRAGSGDEVGPVVDVALDGDSVRLTGDRVAPSYEHRIAAVQNGAGAPPTVMLQSYTGGAHCCTHLQLAEVTGGRLELVDLGLWDGEEAAVPRDLTGDGAADFVMTDQAFLYAFAPYAMSYSVPKVLNVVGGKVVDVSARPAFRGLYAAAAKESGQACRTASDGSARNGACAAYVAASARIGQLDRAWAAMVAAYDASVDWEYPTGCLARAGKDGCPPGQELRYQSYPDALLAFLKREGYVPQRWRPAEQDSAPGEGPGPDDGTETT